MAGLFDKQEAEHREGALPLAARMRPRTLKEVAGQKHFLGEGQLLHRLLKANRLQSLIFYGPPGTGKTTLAEVISQETKSPFVSLNAASIGVKEIREHLEVARNRVSAGGERTVLFVDELHHFSKTQQDVLLPDVENGIVTLIGATTSNPFFALVSALVSRSQIFEFRSLEIEDIRELLQRALNDSERGLGKYKVTLTDEAINFLAEVCDGDARRALNALEIAVLSVASDDKNENPVVDLQVVEESIQTKAIRYDLQGDEHYDAASALIKSMRGSDPDAAIYWMARMLEAGEDPRFIARRLVIAASEDIGNADPQALSVATAAALAVDRIGMPECRINLAQAVTYLATAPKSNASYAAINAASKDVKEKRLLPVPVHLKDSHYPGAQELSHGEGYQYAHNSEDGWVDQDYLGVDRIYYEPVDRGYEKEIAKRLEEIRLRKETSK